MLVTVLVWSLKLEDGAPNQPPELIELELELELELASDNGQYYGISVKW